MIDTHSSVQSTGIMRQRWPDKVMQNENFIETRPKTFVDTAIYVRERQEGAKRLAQKNARICRES